MFQKVNMSDPEERARMTHEAVMDPKPGDRFTERYSFWLYVLRSNKDHVMVIEASAPCTLPDDGKVHIYSRAKFVEKMSYKSKKMDGKYWLDLVSRGEDISWFDEYPTKTALYINLKDKLVVSGKLAEWDKVQDILDDIQELLETMDEKEQSLIDFKIQWENIANDEDSGSG
jgi:hypothetical protein